MKKIILLILILTLLFSSAALAQEMTKEDILQKLDEISTIENDIARLEAYDQFINTLNIKSTDSSSYSPTNNVIAEYSGNGTQNTRPFEVNSPWEIQWDAEGQIFQLYLYDSSGNLIDVAANQMEAGKGSYYSPKTGSFYLQVNAMGDWQLKIVNVD
ncbi:MAG: hypothetical protein BHK79_02850 [Halanaerobium sp. MDAL1]|nr:MAG: hypothetical protein BHK79_02850 [Halanaerobium sp. MDAL1]